ncbi:MAG: hypothetical protein GKR91_16700 [Pseudomonadales bacterium]|nr:hypothetical protein [Pseudomonadales bacterium]
MLFGVVNPSLLVAATLDFTSATYTVSENASTFDVTVNRSGTFNNAASVTVKTTDLTAIAGEDYQNISTVLNWAVGETTAKSVSITILDNTVVNANKTFQLELINLTGDVAGTIDTAVVTIEDYEEGHLALSASSYSAFEDDNSISIAVSRTEGSRGEVGISFATQDNTAKNILDNESAVGDLVFLEGEISKTIDISIVNDEIGEIDKDFLVTLSGITGGAVLGANASAEISIADDDLDFTPGLELLAFDDDNISQPDLVDLNQTSLTDVSQTFIDTINLIPVLATTELVAEQDSSGLISIQVGADKFFLRPVSVIRSDDSSSPSIIIANDHSGYLVTADGVNIDFQPALQPLSLLQQELALVSLPEIIITDTGNLTIQVDQGPPPLEQNEDGELVINNSYYDRYNLRPISVATLATVVDEGLMLVTHPMFTNEVLLAVTFQDETVFRQQLLTAAPYNAPEFEEYLSDFTGVTNVSLGDYGVTTFNFGEETITLLADYIVRRVPEFDTSMIGVTAVTDANGDGIDDLKMIYSSADEQYFFVM